MALTYKGQILNGTIRRQGMYAGGAQHFVLNGKFLCPSGMNFYANDFVITSYAIKDAQGNMKLTVTNAKKAFLYVSCKKCSKKLAELITAAETKKAEATETKEAN